MRLCCEAAWRSHVGINEYVLEIPQRTHLSFFAGNFSSQSVPIIMVSGKVLFDDSNVGERIGEDRNLFQPILFTDPITAKNIQEMDLNSTFISLSKKSYVGLPVGIITSVIIDDAVRASVVEPFYIEPKKIGEDNFTAGAINLYPLELAQLLSEEVILFHNHNFDFIARGAIRSAYDINTTERYQQIFSEENNIDYLVDIRDLPNEKVFDPSIDGFPWKPKYNLPLTYKEYREKVYWQFEYGRKKAMEAINRTNYGKK